MRITPENTRFIAATYGEDGFPQTIVVVSVSNNTIIEIDDLVGGSWSIVLQRLQTYTYTTSNSGKYLSGYRVSASKPVSVFSGSGRSKVLNYIADDAMYVSLPPTAALGKVHFIPSILERNLPDGHLVQVIADEPTDVINLITGSVMGLGAHEYHVSQRGDDGGLGMALECSRSCLVVQITVGRGYDTSKIDPSMRYIPSLESYVRYVFIAY